MKLYIDGPALLEYFVENEPDSALVGDDPDQNRDNLRRWVARYCGQAGCEAVVVWDDLEPNEVRPPTQRFGPVRVVNLPFGEDVFHEIAGPANRDAVEEDRVFVVTDDRRLAGALERGDARVQEPEMFVRRVRRATRKSDEAGTDEPDEKYTGLSEDEVDFWMEYFDRGQ